ncbi:6-phosphofructokinase [Candidatus Viridilinea mediisalina]|uniref:6-phosphofructokinase n=1 Tax=Candidatus Viridilinea mediisalina TaxID=2024553 RepID=A0A2A6RMZ2_9CHLR|nr:6-phosphofructokinase [Candidatus Viridilinea mediisalina]PDW04432.1 6-phosphofructokinase [Candidatus Viridilinea mediisalina]
MLAQAKIKLGVLTSGGDAQGMNAAVRAVVRTGISRGCEVYAIYEGYEGMIRGGDFIRRMKWDSVGGILHLGGTVIGTARSADFRTRDGRRQAVANLLAHGIHRLVVIGGDGSLTGAAEFRSEWPELVQELREAGKIDVDTAERCAFLAIVGLVGSIDNDFSGTDMTIGADSALHRITEALDAITSTAASHQRTFVVEVMGRNCGYLALMGAISGGADWIFIPEAPPEADDWQRAMCEALRVGRQNGRRDSLVVIAEGAHDRHGVPITAHQVKQVLEENLGEDTRVTILGHIQRGGVPSAFDRWMSSLIGYTAVQHLLASQPQDEPQIIGIRENRITTAPLMQCVQETRAVAEAIKAHDYERALAMRGGSFGESLRTLYTLMQSNPSTPRGSGSTRPLRFAILHAGGPSPGMNTAVRVAVRLSVDQGHQVYGVRNGFQGLIDGDLHEMDWMSVTGWATAGGAELGVNRKIPQGAELYQIARNIESFGIDGLLMIGNLAGYQACHRLFSERTNFPAFRIPIMCLPATIDNNLPGSELSIGADSALNSIVDSVDRIKQSAVAARRCFVVEVMGRDCGYLALMGGLASGAERVYLPEEGVTLRDLQADVDEMTYWFKRGKRLSLVVRNENVDAVYTTGFMVALFEQEGGPVFEVRQAILGHIQQGGSPSPFDRIQATRLAVRCVEFLIDRATRKNPDAAFIGIRGGRLQIRDLEDLPRLMHPDFARPRDQWWMELRDISRILRQQPADEG